MGGLLCYTITTIHGNAGTCNIHLYTKIQDVVIIGGNYSDLVEVCTLSVALVHSVFNMKRETHSRMSCSLIGS